MLRLLLLLVIVVGIAGWALDWFTFEKEENAEGKTKIGIVVDDEKIESDAAKATAAAKETAGKGVDAVAKMIADGEVDGTVDALDRAAGTLAVRTAGGEVLEFRLADDVKVKRGGNAASLDDVAVGAPVQVLFEDEDGARRATRILLQA